MGSFVIEKPLLLQTTGVLFVSHPREEAAELESAGMERGIPDHKCRRSIACAG